MIHVEGEEQPAAPAPAWGRSHGAIELGSGTSLQPATARAQVVECVSRYCWAYDERCEDVLGECFAEDAVWEGNVAGQHQVGPLQGRDRIVEWLTQFWPHQHDQRRHLVTNHVVEPLPGGGARLLAYLLLLSTRREAVQLETSGFYRVQLSEADGAWRINHLFGGFDAPFWPGTLDGLSERARRRHGLFASPRTES